MALCIQGVTLAALWILVVLVLLVWWWWVLAAQTRRFELSLVEERCQC
jgi:hypothetical protein